LLNALIGTKIKLVKGYPGTAGIALAMERGEVEGMIGDDWASVKANKADWLREKKIRVLMQMTAQRHPDLPDVPTAGEFAKDDSKRRVLELFVLRQTYGRPFLVPPSTPAPIVAAWRDAFAKLVKDPGFVHDAEQAKLIIKVASGEEVTALVDRIYSLPKPVIDEASALLQSITQ
jgi:tripartite-type tricarboxylate transporter receptor subunit TctC